METDLGKRGFALLSGQGDLITVIEGEIFSAQKVSDYHT
jgi:hypothetical protein